MNDIELNKIKGRTKRAEELIQAINLVDKAILKLVENGRVEEIRISFLGESEGGFGATAGEMVEQLMFVNKSTLKMEQQEFARAFGKAIYSSLKELKDGFEKEYKKL